MGTKHVWRWASPSVSGCRSTNDTYMQLSGKRYVYTDITRKRCIHTDITPTACTHIYAQTIQTHRYHTNGTYTQSHNDAHNTTVRIHPDITQPVHRYHRTVRTQSHHTNGAYTLSANILVKNPKERYSFPRVEAESQSWLLEQNYCF